MTSSKECFKCKLTKPLNEFYAHNAMADGHVNKCKECNKLDVNKHRQANIDKIRKYDRSRAKQKHRIKASTEYTKRWREEYKIKYKAHSAVGYALRTGKLVQQPCIRCQSNKYVIAHHEDYNKPLDVLWLCEICHKQRHKEILNEQNL